MLWSNRRFPPWMGFALLLGCGIGAQAQTWQALPNAPTQTRIDDVFFLDEQMGWTFANGAAYRTLDGGATWQAFAAPAVHMRSIAFTTPARGWIGSLNPVTPLWATADSGKTWDAVALPDPRPAGICGLWAVNERVVYGSGRFNGPAIMIKTTDGGATWSGIDLSAQAFRLIDCRFVDADSGIVVGGTASVPSVACVLATSNGGETWTPRYMGGLSGAWGWKISFVSRRVGFVSVEDETSTHSSCLKTADGGETWIEIASPQIRMQGIGFASEQLGWVCGVSTYRTVNGGQTWTLDPFGREINRMRFLSPTLAYASGRTIYKYSIPTTVRPQSFGGMKSLYGRPLAGPNDDQ